MGNLEGLGISVFPDETGWDRPRLGSSGYEYRLPSETEIGEGEVNADEWHDTGLIPDSVSIT